MLNMTCDEFATKAQKCVITNKITVKEAKTRQQQLKNLGRKLEKAAQTFLEQHGELKYGEHVNYVYNFTKTGNVKAEIVLNGYSPLEAATKRTVNIPKKELFKK